jgi:hypothetical protein
MLITKEFLEDYPLYRKLQVQIPEKFIDGITTNIIVSAIRMYCPVCESDNTFSGKISRIGSKHKNQPNPNLPGVPNLVAGRLGLVESLCASCNDYYQFFILYFDEELQYVIKVGQYPSWFKAIEQDLARILGEHEDTYKKGLTCEAHGYGIGAYAYYRRIIENIIDDLLMMIGDLLNGVEREKFDDALKDIQASIVASEKIALVKDLLPSSLRPDGMNPLSILHDDLSEGIHSLRDEECLEVAGDIRKMLIYLVKQISLANEAKESSYQVTQSMRNSLDRRSKRLQTRNS